MASAFGTTVAAAGSRTDDTGSAAGPGNRVDLWLAPASTLSSLEPSRHTGPGRPAPVHWAGHDGRNDRTRAGRAAGRSFVRLVLADALGIEAGRIDLLDRPGRAPLAVPAGPAWSLARAADLTVVAVTWSGRVGVDVELMDHLDDVRALARAVLHPAAAASVAASPPSLASERFLRLWTLHEAYGKALGVGLDLDPSGVLIRPTDARRARLIEPAAEAGRWWLTTLRPTERHVIGIALDAGGGASVRVRIRDAAGLVRRDRPADRQLRIRGASAAHDRE